MNWELALGIESGAAFVLTLTLAAIYGWRSAWWRSLAGMVLLSSFAIKAVIFGMLFLGRVVGPLGFPAWAVAVLAFDAVQFLWLVLVIKEQRRESRHLVHSSSEE